MQEWNLIYHIIINNSKLIKNARKLAAITELIAKIWFYAKYK